MRFEPRRAFSNARPARPRRRSDALPWAIAFLESFGAAHATLRAAAVRAAEQGVDARQALLAEGTVSETRYYLSLARHLGVQFVETWPQLPPAPDIRTALLRGRVALDDGACAKWLLAPSTRDVELVLDALALGLPLPSIAITTPSHLAAVLRRRAQAAIVHAASHALPDATPRRSARDALDRRAAAVVAPFVLALILDVAFGTRWSTTALGAIFFAGLVFRLMLCAEGVACGGEPAAAPVPPDAALPSYTVLVPLHNEARMVEPLLAALQRLRYPRAKLEVMFLVEADDKATRAALNRRLPPGFRVVEVPAGLPRTKPRALNAGLMLARGDLVTVFDAEDRPEPNQLRRAAAHFAAAPAHVTCLQARLAIDGGAEGLLQKLFAIEYALLFDVFNVGLARRGLPIALGGTSNHFRVAALREAGCWDAWNVTEDADLGLRLARLGHATEIIHSTTWEEAPHCLGDWFRQRRRWTKGWMQTFVVFARDLPAVQRELGAKNSLAVALMLTNLVVGPLLTPIFLMLVAWDLLSRGLPIPHGILEIFRATLAYSVLAIGPVGAFWSGLAGAKARGLGAPAALAAFVPYQLLISAAAWGGLVDLLWRPFHWHKTPHGAPCDEKTRILRRRRRPFA